LLQKPTLDLQHAACHGCVDNSQLFPHRVLKFIPPDQESTLLTCPVRLPTKQPPVIVQCFQKEPEPFRIEYMVKLAVATLVDVSHWNVEVDLPDIMEKVSLITEEEHGVVTEEKTAQDGNVLRWKLQRITSGHDYLLIVTFRLPEVSDDQDWQRRNLYFKQLLNIHFVGRKDPPYAQVDSTAVAMHYGSEKDKSEPNHYPTVHYYGTVHQSGDYRVKMS